MSDIINMKLTNKGLALKDKMEIGDGTLPLKITRIVGGAGKSESPVEQTEVIDIRQTFDLDEGLYEDGRTTISAILTNFNLDDSYEMWQIGFYAMDPDEGEILYRISQFPMPVYVPNKRLSSWTYTPVFNFSTHNASEVIIDIDPEGLALRKHVDTALAMAQQALDIAESMAGGSAYIKDTFTIASTDWLYEVNGKYLVYVDIAIEELLEGSPAKIDIDFESQAIALVAGISPTGETYDGYIRLWCTKRPAGTISGEYTYWQQGSGQSGGSYYVLPIASESRLGGVKIGNNLSIAPDGAISAGTELTDDQIVQDTDTQAMLDDVFGINNNTED